MIVDYQNLRHQAETLNVPPEALFQALWDRTRTLSGLLDIRLFIPVLQTALHWNQVNALVLKHGFSVEACPFLREGTGRKDTVDSVIFRWLVCYASLATKIIFVTGDGDFIIAATLLKMRGKTVEAWSFSTESTSGALFTILEAHILPLSRVVPTATYANPYALAVEKLMGNEHLAPSEMRLLEQLIQAGQFLLGQKKSETPGDTFAKALGITDAETQDLLNTLEGLGVQQSPDSLQTLKLALELKKGG